MDGILDLLKLEIEGIRTVAENQEVDFEGRDKLIQIDGDNVDTGGSSGAGKSTLAIALDYLLGISDVAATVLTPWDHTQTPKVKGFFKRGNIEIEIERSTKNGLSVTVGGEKTSGNSKQAEEKLDEVLGLPRKIIKKMVHKRQDEGSFFIQMGPKEKYEFLITILGLETKNAEIEFIKAEITEQTKELTKLNIGIEAVEKSLDEMEEIKDSKIKPVCTIKESDIADIEVALNKVTNDLILLKSEKESKLSKLEAPVKQHGVKDESKLHELMSEKNIVTNNITTIRRDHQIEIDAALSTLNDAKMELQAVTNIMAKAKELGQNMIAKKAEKGKLEHDATCPTCSQSWTGEGIQVHITKLSNEIAGILSEIMGYKEKIDTRSGIEHKITLLTDVVGNKRAAGPEGLAAEEAKLEAIAKPIGDEQVRLGNIDQAAQNEYLQALNVHNAAKDEINTSYEQPLREKDNKINELKQEKMLFNSQLLNHNTQLLAYDTEVTGLIGTIDKKYTELKEALEKRVKLKTNLELAGEAERCLKSYILNTFQDTLNAIGETATEIVNGIPNVSTATIYFEGFKETKSGGIKNEITAIITKDGHEGIPIKALCGGEGRGIGLAVDLAVIDVIESKANKGANFYLMDEPFNGLDAVCREDCLEIIKGIDSNKKIIVIDHCSELKEMVSDIIVATKEKGKTTFA